MKLSSRRDDVWLPHCDDPLYWLEETNDGGLRIIAAVSSSRVELLLRLAACLPEPLAILWILHVARVTLKAARHQSPDLSMAEASHLLLQHLELFEQDGRSDLWLRSMENHAMLILDRHDRIYGYGPIEDYERILRASGFQEGRVAIPSPHAHDYHPQFDALEGSMAEALVWRVSDLRPEDDD